MGFYEFLWNSPFKHRVLGCDETHLWCATLDPYPSDIQILEQTPAADERVWVNLFHYPKDRKYFICACRLLGVILGYYLARYPPKPRFCYSQHGKAILPGKAHCPSI